jgi:hypothetical protein
MERWRGWLIRSRQEERASKELDETIGKLKESEQLITRTSRTIALVLKYETTAAPPLSLTLSHRKTARIGSSTDSWMRFKTLT